MNKIVTYNFTDDFISNIADYLENNFRNLSRIAIVFGGKRPSLFLNRELCRSTLQCAPTSFIPPQFFSIDQFVNFIVSKKYDFRTPSDLESDYLIYNCAKKLSSEISRGKEGFVEFLPLAREIRGFIDELDIENISTENLRPVESLFEIGYQIPENINKLLGNIIELRNLFHAELRNREMFSRGLMYMSAAEITGQTPLSEFDKILFCNFYYLHKTEKEILKHLLHKEKAAAFFQKDSNQWPVFDDLSEFLGHKIEPSNTPDSSPKIRIYRGFDNHSQVGLVRQILESEIAEKDEVLDKTVIILPDTNNLIPLTLEISAVVKDFNISMGYPLKRSVIYRLTRNEANHWAKDISNFFELAVHLEKFNNDILSKELVPSHPLNIKILERMSGIIDELKTAEFKDQPFNKEDMLKIFDRKLQNEIVPLPGSPLSGLQILGLFESRSLNFENVIIMDVNESVLPQTQIHGSIIPRQIIEGLGLQRLKQEEEIQRYHFMRLVMGAKNVHLVYNGSPEKEKSRFLEEIIWQRQTFPETCAKFNTVHISAERDTGRKSERIIKYLTKDFVYSSSSIDTYLNCPAKFYYQYVLLLKAEENLLDEVEARDVGTFIHELLDYSFRRFLNKKPIIDNKFEKEFSDEFERRFSEKLEKRLGAEAFLVKEVMNYRLKNFIENERSRNVQKILSLEEKLSGEIKLQSNKSIDFTYIIDRIDLLEDNTILVVDYKTGKSAKPPASLKRLEQIKFDRKSIKDAVHSFQLPIYYYFVRQRYSEPINAVLYNLAEMEFTDFVKKDKGNTDKVVEICLNCLDFIISEITNPALDFQRDKSNGQNCKYCEFAGMC